MDATILIVKYLLETIAFIILNKEIQNMLNRECTVVLHLCYLVVVVVLAINNVDVPLFLHTC